MKPGDHPEFFRYPPPPGRSRESSIVLDRDGRFWHDGDVVEHGKMAQAFAGWIELHPDDGRFILTNGYDWTYFTVEDVPFFVRSVRVQGDTAEIELSDGSWEPLSTEAFEEDERGALYLRVKGGKFEARFTASAQNELAPLLVESDAGCSADADGESSGVTLRVNGRVVPVVKRTRPSS